MRCVLFSDNQDEKAHVARLGREGVARASPRTQEPGSPSVRTFGVPERRTQARRRYGKGPVRMHNVAVRRNAGVRPSVGSGQYNLDNRQHNNNLKTNRTPTSPANRSCLARSPYGQVLAGAGRNGKAFGSSASGALSNVVGIANNLTEHPDAVAAILNPGDVLSSTRSPYTGPARTSGEPGRRATSSTSVRRARLVGWATKRRDILVNVDPSRGTTNIHLLIEKRG